MLYIPPLCSNCGESSTEPAIFGPDGTVWSSTVLRIRVADRKPPAVLAYVDFDDGPRCLAHVTGAADEPLLPGTRVRLLGRDDRGDPLVAPLGADGHVDGVQMSRHQDAAPSSEAPRSRAPRGSVS